ncbi:MAG: hypothetical protein JNM52_02005 [Betaproteobacteria bacterium]|nr:hypothetical protein [Betaproteobacteria bacterium]
MIGLLTLVTVSGCAGKRNDPSPTKPPASTVAPAVVPPSSSRSPTLQKLSAEADALTPFATSDLARRFLRAADSLSPIAPRMVYRNDNSREYFSPQQSAALAEAQRKPLVKVTLDEYRYYYTKYGTPLAYAPLLDLYAQYGLGDVAGKRILDFGYGSIGHLRLLASLGAQVVGVDPDSYLSALYDEASDQGTVKAADSAPRRTPAGSVTLVHGFYPKDAKIVEKIGQGYDLIVSKNTLKRGYLKPERKADKRLLISLGVSDEVFLKTLFNALNPGGMVIIYNLYPKPAGPNEAYRPWADGRSPFSKEQYTKAGLAVLALDISDDSKIRNIGAALKWDKNEQGETQDDLQTNLFASYTILQRPK